MFRVSFDHSRPIRRLAKDITRLTKPVLIIQHAPHEHPALLKRALESQFIPTRMLHAFEGEAYPKAQEIRGLVSLGGPMSANDEGDFPWILDETFLMKRCFEFEIPILGICLGGQMLARVMGGRVSQNPHPEIGWFPLQKTADASLDPFFSQLGPEPAFYQWHMDTFHLPPDAKLLARSSLCERQAFSINERTYGFQFHPEVDHQLIQEWLSEEGSDEEILCARMANPHECVQEPREHLRKAETYQIESVLLVTMMTALFQPNVFTETTGAARTLAKSVAGMPCGATSGPEWIVDLKNPYGPGTRTLAGKVFSRRVLNQGNFLFFRENTGLLWPLREDFIANVQLA